MQCPSCSPPIKTYVLSVDLFYFLSLCFQVSFSSAVSTGHYTAPGLLPRAICNSRGIEIYYEPMATFARLSLYRAVVVALLAVWQWWRAVDVKGTACLYYTSIKMK